MVPEKRRFWLPVARLAAFFLAIVVVGNVMFHSFRSASASIPQDPQESVDYFTRKKKRLERRLFRLLDRFFGTPASAATTEDEKTGAGIPGSIASRGTTSERNRILSTEPAVGRAGTLASGPEPFAWPALLAAPVGPEPILPKAMGFVDWPDFRAKLVSDLYLHCGADPLADFGDSLLKGPELLFDGVFNCFGSLSGRSPVHTWEEEESRSVTARMLDIEFGKRDQRIFTVFLQQWTERERRYLGAFDEESRASTYGFQDRTEGADLNELGNDQRKIFWDALRRTYLARYKMQSQEDIPEEAWYFGRWSGVDFVLLPPLLGGYLYYRGLNKRFSLGEAALRLSFEAGSTFAHRKHDRSVAAALEFTVKGFPVGLIVSTGFHDGRYGMDFVGFGTSIGAVRRAVDNQIDR